MSTFDTAPVHDPSWEIWTWGNGMGGVCPRITRYFEVHRYDIVHARNPEHTEFLKTVKFPIYTFGPTLWPTAIPYPRQRIEERFGPEFLNSQAAWALALAIDELRPESGPYVDGMIGIFGVDAALGEEYAYQRQAIQHFIRMGRALHIEIGVATDSDLNIVWPTYPDNMDGQLGSRIVERRADIRQHLKIARASLQSLQLDIAKHEGMLEQIDWQARYHGVYNV